MRHPRERTTKTGLETRDEGDAPLGEDPILSKGPCPVLFTRGRAPGPGPPQGPLSTYRSDPQSGEWPVTHREVFWLKPL